MTINQIHLRWATAAAIVAVIVGGTSYYGGWKANVEQSAIEHAQIVKVLREHDPLMSRMQEEASLNVMQQARIATLETSVSQLVMKMDKLTDALIEQNRHDRYGRP